jgi:hypothetical protein
MRTLRYPRSHCPQLSALPRELKKAVAATGTQPYRDLESFAFLLPGEWRNRKMGHGVRKTLPSPNVCRQLWIPDRARIRLAYGLDEEDLGASQMAARFTATISHVGGTRTLTLMEDTVEGASEELWRTTVRPLESFARRRVELCVSAELLGTTHSEHPERLLVWENPRIISPVYRLFTPRRRINKNAQQREQELKQLRAIGYVQ